MKQFTLAVMLALTACASDPSTPTDIKQPTESDPSRGIICTNEVPTGSSLREKKCTTPEQREAQRRQAEHQIVTEPAKGPGR